MPTVAIPLEFFKKERRQVYSSWNLAFWRELFQNSTDAGATRIDITVKEVTTKTPPDVEGSAQEKRHVLVIFKDDGCGMTRKVLDDVYFRLGETTKKETGDTIGGFGRARILTCFSMQKYEIYTLDSHVVGVGANYDVHQIAPPVRGCELHLEVDDARVENLMASLEKYNQQSDIKPAVYLNGNLWRNINNFADADLRRELKDKKDVVFAKVFVQEAMEKSYYAVVRINGYSMFEQYIGGDRPLPAVMIEVGVAQSRKVLKMSRDAFAYPYDMIVGELMAELATETIGGLKKQKKQVTEYLRKGCGMISTVREVRWTEGGSSARLGGEQVYGEVHALRTIRTPMLLESGGYGHVEPPLVEFRPSPFTDIMISIQSEDPELHAKAAKYDPNNWRYEYGGNMALKFTRGRDAHRLWRAWKECCKEAARCLVEGLVNDLTWSVGFTFCDSWAKTEAVHHKDGDGHHFLISPFHVDTGEERFHLRDRSSLKVLMAIAKHEVAHVVTGSHNETFASALTHIDALYSEWDCYNAIVGMKG